MFHKWTGPIHNEFAIAFKECKPFFARCMKKSNMVNESTYLLIKSELITTIFVSLVSILRIQSGYSTMQKSWYDHFSNLREDFLKTFSTIAYNIKLLNFPSI
jgi:hypothetical protein